MLRLLVVADLAPGRETRPLPIPQGTEGVDAALAELAPALHLSVPNRLGAGPKELAVALRFSRLDDFHPDALARAVPELASLLAAREGLAAGERGEIDRRLTLQVAEIAGAEPLRALEAAWRGVRLMARAADRTDPEGGRVRVEILPAGKDEIRDAFFDEVFDVEHEGQSETPLAAVLLGHEFDRSPADVEVLRDLGRMGESLRIPFLAAVGPAFWGIRQPKLLANLPDLVRKVEGSEYAKWNALRREEVALWLCLAANRVELRDAWGGAEASSPESFEWNGAGDAGQPLWGSGAYALGAVLAQAWAAAGVRFPLTGPQPPAVLDGLPGAPPAEVLLSDQKALELARVGLAPLVGRKGGTDLHFAAAPVLQLPKRYDREEATRNAAAVATLSYQLFAGAAAHALQRIGAEIGPGLPAEEVQQRFAAGMLALLGSAEESPAPEEVQVEVQAVPDHPDLWEVLVRLQPAFPISGASVDLVLGSAVPRAFSG